jgi:hypothetical protein
LHAGPVTTKIKNKKASLHPIAHAGSVKQFKNGVSYVSMLYVQKHTKHTHDTHTYIGFRV